MRRAPVAILCVALIATLEISPGVGAVAGADGSAAAECTWHRHSKRVVKHFRRHGKKRRRVRVRHWWTCDRVAAVPTPNPAPTPAPEPPAAPEPELEPVANRVGVRSKDTGGYTYTLSRPQASAGPLTLELNNEGEDPHNLNLQLQGGAGPLHEIADTGPGQQRAATFDLPAGTYRLWCSLPTHDEQGMHATLILE